MQPDHHRTRHSVCPCRTPTSFFVSKYRRRVCNHAMLTDCEDTLREVCTTRDAEPVEFNGEADHAHLLVRYTPVLALPALVHRMKGATAHRMRGRVHRALQPRRMHGHCWTPPYFAVSAGGAPLAIIKQHIEQQHRPPLVRSRASAGHG